MLFPGGGTQPPSGRVQIGVIELDNDDPALLLGFVSKIVWSLG